MKSNHSIYFIVLLVLFASCTSVPSGFKGVKVKLGGKTDMDQIYDEGLYSGLSWIWNDMVDYDCRETTLVVDYEFNDKNNMLTGVEIALDWNRDPKLVNQMHVKIANLEVKLEKTLKSAGKEVVPQYTATELNTSHRKEAEEKLSEILTEELPQIYCQFSRVQITDVDIPESLAKLAEQTAGQLEKNKLAQQMEAEAVAKAAALVAKSKGEYEAAEYDSKTKALMSQPAMLKLKELDIQMAWATKGVSPYGNNNVFGGSVVPLKMIGGSPDK